MVEAGAPAVSDEDCAGRPTLDEEGATEPATTIASIDERTNERTNAFAGVTTADPPRSSLWSPPVPGVFALSRAIFGFLAQVASAGSTCDETCS